MKPTPLLPLIAALLLATGAGAQTDTAHQDHAAPPASASAAASSLSDGEIRKIDSPQGKINLRHGPISHLEMPAMTMVFVVADEAMLEKVKEGQAIEFIADRVNGRITVTEIKK